ncbi:putative Lom-like outer membrane protein of prophage [Escherichia coli]|nr:putative Lom-like outer membrane protein of prophage [Escherichia coli]
MSIQTHTDMPGSDDLKGINVKYRYEFTDTLGLVTSFSYANAKDEQKTHYSDTRWHEDSVRILESDENGIIPEQDGVITQVVILDADKKQIQCVVRPLQILRADGTWENIGGMK